MDRTATAGAMCGWGWTAYCQYSCLTLFLTPNLPHDSPAGWRRQGRSSRLIPTEKPYQRTGCVFWRGADPAKPELRCARVRTHTASLFAFFLALANPSTVAAVTIDTTESWDGSSFTAPTTVSPFLFGEPNIATIEQTFTVGSANILDSFSFWLDDVGGPGEVVNFSGFVMAWDGAKASGSILFQSGTDTTSEPTGRMMEQFSFTTGGITLAPGQQYVAFLSASNVFDSVADAARNRYPNADVYSGGELVFLANGSDFSKITSFARDRVNFYPSGTFTPGLDAAFTASVSAVP